MNADETSESVTKVKVNFLRTVDMRTPRMPQVMGDGADEEAKDGGLNVRVMVTAIIVAVLLGTLVVTRAGDISTSLAFVLLITQVLLLAYGFFVWLHNPRS